MSLARLAAMGDFWRVLREFNPEGIEREATAPLDLWMVGETGAGKHTLARSLLLVEDGQQAPSPFQLHDLDTEHGLPQEARDSDLIILVVRMDQDLEALGRRYAPIFGRLRVPTLLTFTHLDTVEDNRDLRNYAYRAFSFLSHLRTAFLDARDAGQVRHRLVPLIVEASPRWRTPLARRIPSVRPLVTEQIIAETCRVNAQFALAANLPANIPLLGGVAGNIADFFVLTKNQVMMVFRLAAIYGRDIALTRQVAAEIAPVIGGALMWRSAARMAVGMLPSLLAVVPKTAIAYAGTYVVGHAARYYYAEGQKPSRETLRRFGDEGARLYRRLFNPESTPPHPAE